MIVKTLGFKKTDLLVTEFLERKRYDYERKQSRQDLIVYVLYGQGEHFEGGRHEIGKLFLKPEGYVFNFYYSGHKTKEEVEKTIVSKGGDPDLVNHPALFPYGHPSKEELLPANVILAAKAQLDRIILDFTSFLEQEVKNQKAKLPKRSSTLDKWKSVWRKIRDRVEQGENAKDIERYIQRHIHDFNNLPKEAKTIRKIINAGNAGLLDPP